jgi:hypothetical protein
MKILLVMILLTLISVLYHVSTVYALTGVTSNPVTTKVGTPSGPPPGASSKPTSSASPTDSGPLGVTVTCPLFQNGQGAVNITCGTAKNKAPGSNCGHAVPPSYPACASPPYASCPFSPQLKAAIDVRPAGSDGGGVSVYLPFVNGNQSVSWVRVSGPISITGFRGAYWGEKLEYATTYDGKSIRIDVTHLNRGSFPASGKSGDLIGLTLVGLDGGHSGHLHVAASIDGVWGDSIDQTFICSNRTP